MLFRSSRVAAAFSSYKTVADFIFLGSKITADGDCSHEIIQSNSASICLHFLTQQGYSQFNCSREGPFHTLSLIPRLPCVPGPSGGDPQASLTQPGGAALPQATLVLAAHEPPPGPHPAWTQAIHSALRLDRGCAAGVSAFRELAQVSRACPAAFRPALEKSQAGGASPRPALQGPV